MFNEYVNDEDYFHYLISDQWIQRARLYSEELTDLTTDDLLDMYNNYSELHRAFNDENYKIKMDQVINKLSTMNK